MEFLSQLELTLYDWVLVALLVLNLHWILAVWLSRSQRIKWIKISNWGPVIMLRTTRWLGLIDRLSSPKRFWRTVITAGIPLVIFGMLTFLALFFLTTLLTIQEPPEPSAYTAPRNVLLIPGLNQFIPLWYGWAALLVTLVVHEFAHGILCRVEGIRVKSMGVALLAAPVAAFVEPDDEELFGTEGKEAKASRSARVRILSAGVIANFVVAAIAMALFFGPVIGAIAPHDRVVVVEVEPGSVADLAGFEERMIMLWVDGAAAESLDDFQALYGDGSGLTLLQDGSQIDLKLEGALVRNVMLTHTQEGYPAREANVPSGASISKIDGMSISGLPDFWDYMKSTVPGQVIEVETDQGTYQMELAQDPRGRETGYMGAILSEDVRVDGVTFQEFPASLFLAVLQEIPRAGWDGFRTFVALPFVGISGFTEMGFPGFLGWITPFFEPTGWAEPLGLKVFWIANFLFWVAQINLIAGLFNCLPAVPLDGGHIFRDLLHMVFQRIFQSEERAERATKAVVAILAWLILSSIIFVIAAPYLAHGFGG